MWIRRLERTPQATAATPMGHPVPMVLWKCRHRPRGHLSPVCSIPLTATCAAALLRRAGRRDLPHRCGHGGCRNRPRKAARRRRYRFFEFLATSYGLSGGLLGVCPTPGAGCGVPATLLRAAAVLSLLGRTIPACQDRPSDADGRLEALLAADGACVRCEKSYAVAGAVYARVVGPRGG